MGAVDVRPTGAERRAGVEARDVRPDVRPRIHDRGAKHIPTSGKVFGLHRPSVGPHERYGRGVMTPRPVSYLGAGRASGRRYARIGLKHVAGVGDSCARPINVGTYQGWAARLTYGARRVPMPSHPLRSLGLEPRRFTTESTKCTAT